MLGSAAQRGWLPEMSVDIAPPERSVAERSWGAVYWWMSKSVRLLRRSERDIAPPKRSGADLCTRHCLWQHVLLLVKR